LIGRDYKLNEKDLTVSSRISPTHVHKIIDAMPTLIAELDQLLLDGKWI